MNNNSGLVRQILTIYQTQLYVVTENAATAVSRYRSTYNLQTLFSEPFIDKNLLKN